MKIPLLLTLLTLLAPWSAEAQSVVASTGTLEFQPTPIGSYSPREAVIFFNQSGESVDIYGLGADGPFGQFDWECDGDPSGIAIQPGGTCALSLVFQPREGQSPGIAEGIVGFRLSTGTIITDLRGFAYTSDPLAGVRNIIASLDPLGFDPHFAILAGHWLERTEARLLDDTPKNDKSACAWLQQLGQRAEREAAREHVSDWSAVAVAMQADAISSSLECRVR